MKQMIDFHAVPVHQTEIHERLGNWARWCRGTPAITSSPMFRSYRSTDVWATPAMGMSVDTLDASKIAKAITAIPEPNRHGLSWYYVNPVTPARVCRELAVSMAELARAVIDGRDMVRTALDNKR